MYIPTTFGEALLLCILSALCWGSWANTYKGTRNYPFPLFYWDYIIGVTATALVLALTLGSNGATGEPFLANLASTTVSNIGFALLAVMIAVVTGLRAWLGVYISTRLNLQLLDTLFATIPATRVLAE